MRLSVFKLWITGGFGLLIVELFLFVFLFLRINGRLNDLARQTRELRDRQQDIRDRQRREFNTFYEELKQSRYGGPVEPDLRTQPTTDRPIGSLGPLELVQRLREAVTLEDAAAQKKAENALRGFGVRGAKAIISALPGEPSSEVKRRMLLLLGNIACPDSLSFLQAQFSGETKKALRKAILEGLARQPNETSLGLLQQALVAESDEEIHGLLLEAVRRIETDRAAQLLVAEYGRQPSKRRRAVLEKVVDLKRPILRTFYEGLLRDAESGASIRVLCVRGLRNCADAAVIPLLEGLRENDPDEEVKKEAGLAIKALRG